MAKNVVAWGDWDDDAVADQSNRVSQGLGGDFLKINDGDNYYRFLPPLRGQATPFVEVWQHFVGGDDIPVPGRDRPMVFACPKMTDGDHCSVCEQAAELEKSRVKEDREAARALRPRLRVFANVVDMENPDAGPQILPFGKSIFDQLMAFRKNPRKGGNFTHPKTGFTIIITRTGSKKMTRYVCAIDAEGATELEDYDWITEQHDLSDLVKLPTEEDEALCLTAIEAATGHSGGGSVSKALPRQRRKGGGVDRPARTRRREPEAPIEAEFEEEDDEEEEPEAPVRRRRSAPEKSPRAARARRGFTSKTSAQDALDEDEDY
jgi:hypothetical protein